VAASAAPSGWLADCHVHLHPEFTVSAFLDGAVRNLRDAAQRGYTGMLCLADIGPQRGIDRLRRGARGWQVEETDEAESLLLRRGADVLAIIAGRQVATQERLEVLLLGSAAELSGGQPLNATLERAADTGGVPVVPWGVGKWTFGRGRVVERLLEQTDAGALFLGDNGNRPAAVPTPRLLRRARKRGFRILPGSDPLPLAFHAARAGSCGIRIGCEPDLQRPARQLIGLLRALTAEPDLFCRPESLHRFVLAQTLIRLRRRPPLEA
jgi:hypothetical protein